MGEPIKLYKQDGEVIHVYTRSQAATMLAGGEWFASTADAEAGKVREEPTPAVAAKLDALEGQGAGIVTEVVTEAPASEPEPAAEATTTATAKTTRKATAKRDGKGGL